MPGASLTTDRTPLLPTSLSRGIYAASGPNDIRSPCPLVNSLANHGYINRDGKNIRANDLKAAMSEVGISTTLGAIFSQAVYNEHQDPKTAYLRKQPGFLGRLWRFLSNPWSLFAFFGLRRHGQKDAQGKKVLDLDQLALPGVIEHDISLSRRDHLQKEGASILQPDLVEDMLKSSSDGGKTLTMADLAGFRKRRIQRQLDDNPGLKYGSLQHELACGEIALILNVFGNGQSLPCSYARAFFMEERLPVREGWKKRWWWTAGLFEIGKSAGKVKSLIGIRL